MKFRWILIIAGVAAACVFYLRLVAPLRSEEQALRKQVAKLSGKIAADRVVMEEIRDGKRPSARQQSRSAATATAWFPSLVEEHFRRFGLKAPVTHYNNEKSDPRLPGILRTYWTVDLPLENKPGQIVKVLRAMAEFEKVEPNARAIEFATGRDPERPENRSASIAFTMLARE